jgi:hypothetical protein
MIELQTFHDNVFELDTLACSIRLANVCLLVFITIICQKFQN